MKVYFVIWIVVIIGLEFYYQKAYSAEDTSRSARNITKVINKSLKENSYLVKIPNKDKKEYTIPQYEMKRGF